MRVGILSMQRIKNYGSFLQAYGLKSMLEAQGAEVEFVDYHPGQTLLPADGGTGVKRKISKVLETFDSKAPLKEKLRFIKYKKNFEKNYFPYLNITNEMNYAPDVDVLVVGSDEVFNCVQSNTNVGFTPELFGQNSNAKKVVSYAASFGNTTIEKLKQYSVDNHITEWLGDFDNISVRDQNSYGIVKQLTGKIPQINLDPVLMYDYMGSGKIPKVDEKGYMMLYGYSGRFSSEECRRIRAYADSRNLKIYCIGGIQDCCDKFIDCDPYKVIAYFKGADYVITDTFHGTILSVITKRPFVSLVRSAGYGNSQKLEDLLRRLRLENRIVDTTDNLQEKLNVPIDYSRTFEVIASERKRTGEYLKKCLK